MATRTMIETPARSAHSAAHARPGALATWLFAVAALVALMVTIGGITRLTESGLSIVEWKPLAGTLPPLSATAWAAEFDAYKTSSQYQIANHGMTLAQFQGIYWWEYAHRLLGRVIGLAFALPLAWFAVRRAIPRGLGPRLVGLLALGGMQGVIGWWMVASGLVNRTDVAHERLAVHLFTALTLFAAILWTALDLRAAVRPRLRIAVPRAAAPRAWIMPLFALLALQLVLGAFTAGLHAGHASDTWPLMTGALVPALAPLAGWWNDPFTVQFAHRTTAYAVAAFALLAAWRMHRAGAGPRAIALGGAVLVQFALGVLTIVWHVPIALAAMHQAGAVLLLASLVVLAHWSTRRA